MTNTWYKSKTSGNQGLIIDEKTGTNIAVSYKEEDACLIASAPDLLRASRQLMDEMLSTKYKGKPSDDTLDMFVYAISKAKGN